MIGKVTVTSVSAIDYAQWLASLERLYAGRDTWTQFANARNADGAALGSVREDAVCWCLYGGAIRVTAPSDGRDPKWRADTLLDFMADELPPDFRPDIRAEHRAGYLVLMWNDTPGRTHEEVRQFVSKCLQSAEKAAALLRRTRSR